VTQPAPKTAPLLALRGITKVFPGVRALDNVDFTLRGGEIHALMGENGAGKSTLIKVLTGVYPRDAGEITLAGQPISPRSPAGAQALGISTVYQEVNLIPHLSVAENIFLGRQPRSVLGIRWRRIQRQAEAALARLLLKLDVNRPLSSYSIAVQQMVAIARALDVDARVLVLDEPTSSLDAAEVAQLFALMRRLKAEGLGIIFITHFLEQVYESADRITVLRNGRLVGDYATAELPRLELVAKMIGKEVTQVSEKAAQKAAPAPGTPAREQPLLRARQFGKRGALLPIDMNIHAGEVVGLAGLLGSGRTETARLLFGIERADHGRLEIGGEEVKWHSPRRAIARGLGFCPEDRKTNGIVPHLSVRENIVLALQARRGWLRALSRAAQRELANTYIRALGIATPGAEKTISELSGGNQQKAILARWLAAQPKLLILDEPTRGIDVGAKAEIEKLVAKLCAQNMAILFISSELDEVTRNSHRVIVLRDRRKVGELTGDAIDVGGIMRMIAAPGAHDAEAADGPTATGEG
jgi:galactofuranose transport system ATP-binding protein